MRDRQADDDPHTREIRQVGGIQVILHMYLGSVVCFLPLPLFRDPSMRPTRRETGRLTLSHHEPQDMLPNQLLADFPRVSTVHYSPG